MGSLITRHWAILRKIAASSKHGADIFAGRRGYTTRSVAVGIPKMTLSRPRNGRRRECGGRIPARRPKPSPGKAGPCSCLRGAWRFAVVAIVESIDSFKAAKKLTAKIRIRNFLRLLGHVQHVQIHLAAQDVPRKVIQVRYVILGYPDEIDPPPGKPRQVARLIVCKTGCRQNRSISHSSSTTRLINFSTGCG